MKKNFIDYYQVLGINIDATQEEIKKAFHTKIKEEHPDIYEGKQKKGLDSIHKSKSDAQSMTRLLLNAYHTLMDKEKRKEYDKYYLKNKELQKESKKSSIKSIYQQVKKEEQRNSFYVRHNRIDNIFYDEEFFNSKGLNIKRGSLHILGEMIYHLNKLRFTKKDNAPKYIIRNRGLIGLALVGYILVNGLTGKTTSDIQMLDDTAIIYHTQTDNLSDYSEYEEIITLNREYTIQYGDTLSEIAEDAGVYVSTIKRINDIKTDNIYWKDILLVPYRVPAEDLPYYSTTVDTAGKTVSELAEEYETDSNTLILLNNGAIQIEDGNEFILTNEIVVPVFRTKEEVNEMKRKAQRTGKINTL